MKFTQEQIEISVKKLIAEGKNEDAILLIMYELAEGSCRNIMKDQFILDPLMNF